MPPWIVPSPLASCAGSDLQAPDVRTRGLDRVEHLPDPVAKPEHAGLDALEPVAQLARPVAQLTGAVGGPPDPVRDLGGTVGGLAGLIGKRRERRIQAVRIDVLARRRVAPADGAERPADCIERRLEERVGLADGHRVQEVPGAARLALGGLGAGAQRLQTALAFAQAGGEAIDQRRELPIESPVELVVAVGDPPGAPPRAGRAAREPVRSVERLAQPVLETAEALPDLPVAAGDPLPPVAGLQHAAVQLLRAGRRAAQPAAQLGDAVRRPAQSPLEPGQIRPALFSLLLGAFELPGKLPDFSRLPCELVRAHDELGVGNQLQLPLEGTDLFDSLRVQQRPVRGPENDVDLRAEAGFPDRQIILEHLVVRRQLARVGRNHVARKREDR